MIRVRSNNPDHIYVSTIDIHGGQELVISLSQSTVDSLNWVQSYRLGLEKEIELRNSTPALASAWDQYQTMLRIVMDDV
jgi:hypothetical protein